MPASRLVAFWPAIAFSGATLAHAGCVPVLPSPSADSAGLLNVFKTGKGPSVWEYLPPSPSFPKSGGALYLSQTDTPEDGAFYFTQRTSVDPAAEDELVWTLSLGSRDPGVQCVTAQGTNMAVTTGSCDQVDAEFSLSCLSCAGAEAVDEATTGTDLAKGCTLRSVSEAEGQCLTSVSSGATTVAQRIATRACKGRAPGQLWDLTLA